MGQHLDTCKISIPFEKEGSIALVELINDFLSGNIPEQMISSHKGLFYFNIAKRDDSAGYCIMKFESVTEKKRELFLSGMSSNFAKSGREIVETIYDKDNKLIALRWLNPSIKFQGPYSFN